MSNKLEFTLHSIRILALVIGCLAAIPPATLACSCRDGGPVQATDPRYRDSSVFRARVIQFLGKTGGTKELYSDRALAVVNERYWGLPWYWPRVVILDGHGVCGYAFALGEEYLIVGHRNWYGALDVGECSGTRPLRNAQVDMRTLDGSRCAGPGGSILGSVYSPAPTPNIVLTLRDSNGRPYTARTDQYGIYELRHLSPDRYTLDSRLSTNRYASATAEVSGGICAGGSITLQPYSLSGRLLPGIGQAAFIEIVEVRGKLTRRGEIAPDGRFYFNDVPPGEYFLAATFFLTGRYTSAQVYYPGTRDRRKATAIRVSTQPAGESFDFDPEALPLVPMPVVVASPDGTEPSEVTVRLQDSRGIGVSQWEQRIGVPLIIPGVRGDAYGVMAFATRKRAEDPDRRSALITLHAAPGMKTTVLSLIRTAARRESVAETPIR